MPWSSTCSRGVPWCQIATTLDDYVYTSDDDVVEGEIEEGRRYVETDFNRVIEIRAREQYRVKTFMGMIDQREKTLVFCDTPVAADADSVETSTRHRLTG